VTADRKTISGYVLYGSILLALVVLVVTVWGFGGFKQRTDLFKTAPPGTLFSTGPYEFRFTEATAQHKKDYGSGSPYWEVVMVGEGRTTGNESASPDYSASGIFVSKDDVTQQIVLPESVELGQGGAFRQRFTPGLPLLPYSVEFNYDDSYRPGPTIRLVVWDLVYGKHALTSDEETWHRGTYRHQFYLPVRVLPEDFK
jgi:hypothetical protein